MSTATASAEQTELREGSTDVTSGSGLNSQVVSFRLANEEYGLDIMTVQEIILMGAITQIPEVPPYIRGLINLRGKVIPIVDLRKRFGLDAAENSEHTRIIVVNAGRHTFGIVVDAVSEVLRIEGNQVEPPPAGLLGLEQAYIKGLVKMEEKIMILLNLESVLSKEDQVALKSATSTETEDSTKATKGSTAGGTR